MQKRLLKATKLMRYCKTVGCRLTVLNTIYNTVIKSFTNQWARLKDWKQQTQPMVQKIIGELTIMKIGVRTTSLSYMTREFDSIEEELVAQVSHTHPLYHKDNAAVYYCLEEVVQGTQYVLSLKPFQQ
eukprot:15059461-Ditylum_brightwellii.AAC.1